MLKRTIFMLTLMVGIVWNLHAQNLIKGKVTDSKTKETIPSVNVRVKGSNVGAMSDLDGNYSITVNGANDVLVFSFVGYQNMEMAVGTKTVIDMEMLPDVLSLDQAVVVAVGYGTLDRKEVTSSITSIKSADMIPGSQSNPLMGIQGKVTGLDVNSENGNDPNSKITLQLRGANSVKAGMGPLVVIDGIPGGDLNSVSSNDILSIDVLKDGSAAAIYGTRATGGVILITTKKAKAGELSISYQGEATTETIRRYAEALGREEYLAAGLGEDLGHNTDWFDLITHTLFSQKHSVSLSGGSNTAKVYASLYYRKFESIVIDSDKKELGGRVNMDFSAFDNFLNISTNVSYSQHRGNKFNRDIFRQAIQLNPTETAWDADDVTGMNVWTGGWEYYNPLADIKLKTDRATKNYLLFGTTAKLNLTKDLTTSFNLGYRLDEERSVTWKSAQHRDMRASKIAGEAWQKQERWDDVTFEWLTNYEKKFDKHSLKLLAGWSYQMFDRENFEAKNQDFPVDGVQWYDMESGTFLTDGRASIKSNRAPTEKIGAALGRVNYAYDNRYMMSASLRYEGSSKFAPDVRWGFFPAVSAGWRISEESFMKDISQINDIKIRGGFGVTGNQDFDKGVYTRVYSADGWWLNNGKWIKPYGLSGNTNPDLKWETKTDINVGIDFALFNNRLSGKIDIYQRKIKDLLFETFVPQPPYVHDKTLSNAGSMTNNGWEVELSYLAISNDKLQYTTTLRASSNKGKLKSLGSQNSYMSLKGLPAPGSPGDAVRVQPGEAIGQFYIWKSAGFTDEGKWQIYDQNNKVILASDRKTEDKRFIGNAIPKVMLSWENSVKYKGFDASVYFRSWIDFDVYNLNEMYYGIPANKNQNVVKAYYDDNKHITEDKYMTDYFMHDGTFLKLDALTLGYTFDVEKIKFIKNMRLFLNARNLFVLTSYKGLDPEVNTTGLTPGFEERDVYPRTRTFTVGLQLSF